MTRARFCLPFFALALLLAAFPAGRARADDPNFRLKFEGQLAYKTGVATNWDLDRRDPWSNVVDAYMAASAAYGANFAAYVSGLFDYHLDVGEKAHGVAIPELRELYGKARWGKLDVFFGQQIVSWGVSDFASPMDLLNPYDFRRVIDMELPYSRLGTLMIRPVLYLDPVQLEAVYLPLFTPARYDIVGGNWALVGKQFPVGDLVAVLRGSASWRRVQTFIDQWIPSWQTALRDVLSDPGYYANHTQLPDQNLLAPQAAARVKYHSSAIDVSAAYFYLWDELPTLHLNPILTNLQKQAQNTPAGTALLPSPELLTTSVVGAPFELTHHRVQTAALGLSSSVHEIGLRAEGVLDFGRWVYRTDATAVKRDDAQMAFNIDYTFEHDVFLEGVLLEYYLFHREHDFLQPAWTHLPGVVLRVKFLSERLTWDNVALVDVSNLRDRDRRDGNYFAGGWFVTPMLTYAVLDPLKVSLGANLLGGRNDTILGRLGGNSRVFTEVRWGF